MLWHPRVRTTKYSQIPRLFLQKNIIDLQNSFFIKGYFWPNWSVTTLYPKLSPTFTTQDTTFVFRNIWVLNQSAVLYWTKKTK